MKKVSRISKFNTDGRTDFMTPETAAALMIAAGKRPDELIYTDNDPGYVPPAAQSGETFDTVTEVYGNAGIVYGIGVVGKGTNSERCTRIIYPDKSFTTLTGW